jgi:adenylate cyclase
MHDPPRILIVDDNATNRDILAVRLATHGYDLHHAADGLEALAAAQKLLPDLILLDVMMPKLNGIDVCRRLKGDVSLPFMPIILVTSRADSRDIVAGLDAGADEYLTKPVDQAALVARVKSVLRLKGLHDHAVAQAADLAQWNESLEQRVATQVDEIQRISRLTHFLPRQVARLVVSEGEERMLESHRRAVTVLFCDLRGFSAFSELAEPEEVIAVLREYHNALGKMVEKYEGTVDSFTGDGLLVIFNDPVPCEEPSLRAVRMAVEMRDELAILSAKWSRFGHDIGFGIGIAHGYATLGTIGYEGRFQYSVMGKVANLAARLCDKAENGQIVVDVSVCSAVETLAEIAALGEFSLKGFARPVKAFNIANVKC